MKNETMYSYEKTTPLDQRPAGCMALHIDVNCSCGDVTYLSSKHKRAAATEAKEAGWKFTRKYGWLCRDCAKLLKGIK